MKTNQISIITRTRNRPLTLRRLAENLAGQTSQIFEWIVINDAGDFAMIAEALARTKIDTARVVTIDNQTPRGRSYPLNIGLKAAKGKYVVIVDDDDFLEANALEIMHTFLTNHECIDAVAVHTQVVLEKLTPTRIIHKGFGGRFTPQLIDLRPDSLILKNRTPIHSIMAKRSAMLKIGGFPKDIEYTEDWYFWFHFSLKFDFAVIPQVLAYYSYRPKAEHSYQNSVGPGINLDVHSIYAQKWQLEFLRKNGLLNDLLTAALLNAKKQRKRSFLQRLKNLLLLRWDNIVRARSFRRNRTNLSSERQSN